MRLDNAILSSVGKVSNPDQELKPNEQEQIKGASSGRAKMEYTGEMPKNTSRTDFHLQRSETPIVPTHSLRKFTDKHSLQYIRTIRGPSEATETGSFSNSART